MKKRLYKEFTASDDTLRIYRGNTLLFSSKKEGLLPLMEYLGGEDAGKQPVTICDKVMGNAAALLSVRAGCREAYSPLGSEIAVASLDRHGISHHLETVVPYIQRADGRGMCPMEELSLGKGPEEFYEVIKARIKAANQAEPC